MPKGREKMLGAKIERVEKEKAELLGALKALYQAVDSCVDLTPEVMLRAREAIEKADRLGAYFNLGGGS